MSKKRASRRRILLVALGTALGVGFLEGGFQAYYFFLNDAETEPAALRAAFGELKFREVRAPDGTVYFETDRSGDGFRFFRFRESRTPKTLRIAVLGESAAWGANYAEPVHFPHTLQMLLASRFPDREVEIINGALPGIVSARSLQIAKDLFKAHPDMIIAYMGNNECFSPTSVLPVATEYWLYRMGRWSALCHFLSVRNFAAAARKPRKYARYWRSLTDLEVENFSPFGYRMRTLVSLCRANHVRLVLCTVAVNESDWPPAPNSFFSRELSDQERERWRSLVSSARQSASAGRLGEAAAAFEAATKVAYEAGAQYDYGRCLLRAGRYEDALKQLRLAILYSVTRIKPPMNDFIRRLAASEGLPLVDIDSLMRERSPHGIIGFQLKDGKEVFDDDVHFSIIGQYLVAIWISQALEGAGLVLGRPTRALMSFDEYWRALNLYPADLESSYREISKVVLQQNLPRGMHFVDKALALAPNDPKVLLYKGVGLQLEGNAKGASRLIKTARGIDPRVTDHLESFFELNLRQHGYLP